MKNVAFRIPSAMLTIDFSVKAWTPWPIPQSSCTAPLLLSRWWNWIFFDTHCSWIDNYQLTTINQHSITPSIHLQACSWAWSIGIKQVLWVLLLSGQSPSSNSLWMICGKPSRSLARTCIYQALFWRSRAKTTTSLRRISTISLNFLSRSCVTKWTWLRFAGTYVLVARILSLDLYEKPLPPTRQGPSRFRWICKLASTGWSTPQW